MLTRGQYGSTHIVLSKSFDEKTIWFNPYSPLKKPLLKDNMVQPIFSFSKVLTKRQYGSTHVAFFKTFDKETIWINQIFFFKSFDQKTISLNPYCLFRKFWPKDTIVEPILFFKKIFVKRPKMVQPISSFLKVLTKPQNISTNIVFFESSYQKTIWFNP